MAQLILSPNITETDQVYDKLVQAHEGLSDHESLQVNARLILLLINHIGDEGVIDAAIALARRPASRPSY